MEKQDIGEIFKMYKICIKEQIGINFSNILYPVDSQAPGLVDQEGEIYPIQCAPAWPTDFSNTKQVDLINLSLAAEEKLVLEASEESNLPTPFNIKELDDFLEITQNNFGVIIPRTATWDLPFPGPVSKVTINGKDWLGESWLVGAQCRGKIETVIESIGPSLVQWSSTYRWGCHSGLTYRVRWAAGSDTLQVMEIIPDETQAAIEWFPLGSIEALAYCKGGGEDDLPMVHMQYKPTPKASSEKGRRFLEAIGHISSFNQWCQAWVGFIPANFKKDSDPFVGIYSAWGGMWERRGYVRPEVYEEDGKGHFIRFPIRKGKRFYGIVLSTRKDAQSYNSEDKCLLNRRKTENSDLSLTKVQNWQLDMPVPQRKANLVSHEDLNIFRDRLKKDADIGKALQTYIDAGFSLNRKLGAGLFFCNDKKSLNAYCEWLVIELQKWMKKVQKGGYEALAIFHGRMAKSIAYDIDVLWSEGVLAEEQYVKCRKIMLMFAYMYSDPNYCNYEDYWPLKNTDEDFYFALKDEMGDSPVPPNFASEFFSTVGVIAELFPEHSNHQGWRKWTLKQNNDFLETFFAADGTYFESINYHSHAISELLCYYYALKRNGGKNYFEHPIVKGTFKHFVDFALPPLSNISNNLTAYVQEGIHPQVYANPNLNSLSMFPADGNSGSHGMGQYIRDDLPIAAALYAKSDPALAGELMHLWRIGGKPILNAEHPMLTILTLDPGIPSKAFELVSSWRKSQGIISKTESSGTYWSYFRAGRATHHMDFDQGNIILAYKNKLLLADHGYHSNDTDGSWIPASSTWLHNTLTYGEDKELSSGYTGLELAPEPILVEMNDKFDWVVHRIENTNYRNMRELSYRDQIPCPKTVHFRHYLAVKPNYILVWDILESCDSNPVFWLHSKEPFESVAEGEYISGKSGEAHLQVIFHLDGTLKELERRQVGPLYCLGMQGTKENGFLALLLPQCEVRKTSLNFDRANRTVNIKAENINDTIILPEYGTIRELPIIKSVNSK